MFESKLFIIIPAFNESATVFDVVKWTKFFGDVIVLDDASTDDTKAIALKVGAKVASNNTNLGYEKTLSYGIKAAIEDYKYNYLITIDADGEHNPDNIAIYVEKLTFGVDLVCGERNFKNRFSEEIWGFFGSRGYGINDPLCGFKDYSLEFIRQLGISVKSNSVGGLLGTKLLKKILNLKWRHENINIKVSRRIDESRIGVGIKVNFRIVTTFLHFLRA